MVSLDTKEFKALAALIRKSLWDIPIPHNVLDLGEEEWKAVLKMACRQSVQGISFDAVRNLPGGTVPTAVAASWLMEFRKVTDNNARIMAVADRQAATWARRGVNAVQIKGRTVAELYPVPESRVCGDIDWWMPSPEDWDKALEVVKSNGLEYSVDSDGDIAYELGGVVVEHHRHGYPAEGPEGFLCLLNEHILHHLSVTGIGLRHFCDYAVARVRYRDAGGYPALMAGRRLRRWTAFLDALTDKMSCPRTSLSDLTGDEVLLLRLVIQDGNFGLDKERRLSGFHRRALLLLRYCPVTFAFRWLRLGAGRIRRMI